MGDGGSKGSDTLQNAISVAPITMVRRTIVACDTETKMCLVGRRRSIGDRVIAIIRQNRNVDTALSPVTDVWDDFAHFRHSFVNSRARAT
jgi:hypothetical protein